MSREIEIRGKAAAPLKFTLELAARGKALTKAETDHLLNVVADYCARVGFTSLTIGGFRRSDALVDRDFFRFQVVEKGERWEDRTPVSDPARTARGKPAPKKRK